MFLIFNNLEKLEENKKELKIEKQKHVSKNQ